MNVSTSTAHRHFHEELELLKQRLLDMSERAEDLLARALDALRKRDEHQARSVVQDDSVIDRLEIEVEQHAVALLATQQPMARDLRFIVSAIKIASDVERVGDHAVNIAEAALRLIGSNSAMAPGLEIDDMARRARMMLADALDAFLRSDGELGRNVCRADDAVDQLMESAFRVLLTRMMENPHSISHALQYLLVARNIERVADLATNIGEDAVYLAEGLQVKHHNNESVD